ncbi:hypothetical protein NXH76_02470 [Blautia schinkii]|nr:hypothetical protein [Blautia schinkii]
MLLGLEWYWWLVILVLVVVLLALKIKFIEWWGQHKRNSHKQKEKWGDEE